MKIIDILKRLLLIIVFTIVPFITGWTLDHFHLSLLRGLDGVLFWVVGAFHLVLAAILLLTLGAIITWVINGKCY